MAILGTLIILCCLVFKMPLENLPFLLIGALFIILYEFHSRIHGKIGLGNLHTSVVHRDGQTEEMPALSPQAHLRDVSEPEWQRPTAERRRRR